MDQDRDRRGSAGIGVRLPMMDGELNHPQMVAVACGNGPCKGTPA